MARSFVGLDVGTSSVKAVVVDERGTVVGSAKLQTPWRRTQQGTEVDPAELGRTAVDVLDRAVGNAELGTAPAGIGITSMGETGVLIDAHGDPIGSAIAWHDDRDGVQVAALEADVGALRFAEITGKPLRSQFSLTKYAWLIEHTDDTERARRRFNVADWIACVLTGVEVCDASLAGRTGWFDPLTADWSAELLDWSGATAELMPPLIRPGDPVGTVAIEVDRLDGAVVTTAGHDHQAAMLGCGLDTVGDELDSCGTAEAIVRIVPDSLARPVMRDLALDAVTTDIGVQRGTLCLLGGTQGGRELQNLLADFGGDVAALPKLDDLALGLAEPRDAMDRDRGQRWRDTVERSTAEAAELHQAITAAVGGSRRLVVTGGWSNSRTVVASKRRHLGDLHVATVVEAGARGAAILAARATGDLGAGQSWTAP